MSQTSHPRLLPGSLVHGQPATLGEPAAEVTLVLNHQREFVEQVDVVDDEPRRVLIDERDGSEDLRTDELIVMDVPAVLPELGVEAAVEHAHARDEVQPQVGEVCCGTHERHAKESACGCAGIFNAPFAIESYALVFEEEGALDKLEGFASEFGPRFYRLPLNDDKITLTKAPVEVPLSVDANGTPVSPFHAGETIGWKF